jgi:hypothetical protein
VEKFELKPFNTIARTIQNNYEYILNYFDNRSINTSAESFNAKIKALRGQFRGVRDISLFLVQGTKNIYLNPPTFLIDTIFVVLLKK